MNPILLTMHTHAERGQPVALMRYPDGAAFYADRRGCIVGPRGQRGQSWLKPSVCSTRQTRLMD